MPVHPITYVYIVLMLWDGLSIVLAAVKRNEEHLQVLIPVLPLFFIGFMSNYTACWQCFP